jgi:hypothetical protein
MPGNNNDPKLGGTHKGNYSGHWLEHRETLRIHRDTQKVQ